MDVKVDRIIDGDTTIYTTPDGDLLRGRSDNTAALESTTTTGKQSLRGIDQTNRVKTYLRPGDNLEIKDNTEKGVFGRSLVSPKKIFNGKEVDLNFLKTALGDNQYYTKYGLSKENHEHLKTGYNTWLPYQFKDDVEPLSKKDFEAIDKKLPEIQSYIENMKGGGNGEQQLFLDTLIGNVFGGDGSDKVAAYLDIKKKKELMLDRTNQPLSADKIMYDAFKDPRMQEEWDRSVIARQGIGDVRLAYKGKHNKFQEKVGAAMQLFNDMSNYVDRDALFMAQHSQLKITDDLLHGVMSDIPEEFRGIVTDEARKYGNERAYVKAEQLKKDIKSHAIFDNMNIAEQFVYGAGAYLTSLGSLTVGLKGFELAGRATKVIRAWKTIPLIKALATSGTWIAAAGADSIAMEGPRLLGDATYSPQEMVVDVALDTAIGAGLPLLLMGGSKVIKPHIRKFLGEAATNKLNVTRTIERDILNEASGVKSTHDETLGKGIDSWEKKRGSDTKREETTTIHRKEVDSSIKSDAHAIDTSNGDGAKSPTEPIDKGRIPTQAEKSQKAAEDVVDGGWVSTGLAALHNKAKKSIGVLGKVGQSLANLTGRAISHRLQSSDNAVMTFIGHVFLEDPSGYGGGLKRHTTAALLSKREKDIGLSMILPDYARHIEEWANKKGSRFYETFKAKWGTPEGNKLAKQFEEEFIEALNARKMGRVIEKINPSIVKMLDSWKNFTDHMGNRALEEGLPGWTKLRKNYFPQIRNNQRMHDFIKAKKGNKEVLRILFEKGIRNAKEAGIHTMDDVEIKDLAREIVEQAKTGKRDLPESTSGKLGRAQHRVEMDWSAKEYGVKLSDFLRTDIASTAERYANDIGGRIGIHRVTGGKLATDADLKGLIDIARAKHAVSIETLKKAGKEKEAIKLNKKFNTEVKLAKDAFNMILGRPTRGGLAPELRHLKTFAMHTRMGVLGTSQSIETGNVIARSVVDLFSDPEVLKHLMSMNPKTPEGRVLLDDIMNITGRTKDVEYLNRPQQVLDEESLKSYNKLRQLSIMLADKATGGDLKQPISRILTKTSMFNWVQKHQSEFVQKSFLIHTDRYFTTGKCGINPKRMMDLGLIDLDGKNNILSDVFNNVVKKDENGFIKDLQWDKWSEQAKREYMDAAQRDEAQRLQQTFAGEAPAYYNAPLMKLLFQFREVPLVAQNKQLARNLMFGDVETASSIMLNLAVAGMVRYAWLSGLGYAKAVVSDDTDNFTFPGLNTLNVNKYMAAGGLFPDAVEMLGNGVQGFNQRSPAPILRQIPALGVLKDAKDFALGNNKMNKRAEALQGITPLGTVWWMDIIHTMLVKNINDMATHKEYEEGE